MKEGSNFTIIDGYSHNAPRTYLKQIVSSLACYIFGAQKIIFGTDYPFGPRSGVIRLANYAEVIEGADISSDEKQMIFEENVTKLLKI